MTTKQRTIQAYEIRLTILRDPQTAVIKWDNDRFETIINGLYGKSLEDKTLRKRHSWVMFLEALDTDDDYYWGAFAQARYGSKAYQLIDGERLTLRENPREVVEGEKVYTHFLIRKRDGLLLLEYGFQDVVSRTKIMEYIEECARVESSSVQVEYTYVNPLLSAEFFEEVSKLNQIKAAHIEILTKQATGLNPAFQAMTDKVDEVDANSFQISIKAKRRGSLTHQNVRRWLEPIMRANGVVGVRVAGNIGNLQKVINLEKNAEKYKRPVEIDDLGQVKSESIYGELKDIAEGRYILPNQETISDRKPPENMEDDE